MPLHLDFLNKSLFRKYPVRATSTWTTKNGIVLPLDLFTGMKLTTTYTRQNVYIKYLVVKANYFNITLVHRNNPVTSESSAEYGLGSFGGTLVSDYQSFYLQSFDGYSSGWLTIGNIKSFAAILGSHEFTYDNGKIEDSLIFCYIRPLVSGITDAGQTLTGNVIFDLSKLTAVVATPDIDMTVNFPAEIASRGDLNSSFNNCTTPVIKQINTVFPDGSGNIDIYGIEPVEVNVVAGKITLSTGTLGINDICTKAVANCPPEPYAVEDQSVANQTARLALTCDAGTLVKQTNTSEDLTTASAVTRLLLTCDIGTIVKQLDNVHYYTLTAQPPSTALNWTDLGLTLPAASYYRLTTQPPTVVGNWADLGTRLTVIEDVIVADQTARLALTCINGTIALQSSNSHYYILNTQPPSVSGNWTDLGLALTSDIYYGSILYAPDAEWRGWANYLA